MSISNARKRRRDDMRPRNFRGKVSTVSIPSRSVRLLIGNKGSVIKTLEQNSGSIISIPAAGEDGFGLVKTITIKGSAAAVHAGSLLVLQKVREGRQYNYLPSEPAYVVVPASKIPLVIGKGGSIIKELELESKCRIAIPKVRRREDIVQCTITGTFIDAQIAVIMMSKLTGQELYPQSMPMQPLWDSTTMGHHNPTIGHHNSIIRPSLSPHALRQIMNPMWNHTQLDQMSIQSSYLQRMPNTARGYDSFAMTPNFASSLSRGHGLRSEDRAHTVMIQGNYDPSVLYLCIPKQIVRLIIGKGGCEVKELESSSGARVSIPKTDRDDWKIDKVVSIKGTSEQKEECSRMIFKKIHEKVSQINPKIAPMRIVVPSNKIRLVIGKSGATVKNIESQTGAQVLIPSRSHELGTEAIISLKGDIDETHKAQAMILDLLSPSNQQRDQQRDSLVISEEPKNNDSHVDSPTAVETFSADESRIEML